MDYSLGEPSKEENLRLTEELKAILEKYDCEMQVTSTINILKRIHADVVESPYNGTEETEEKSDSAATESSESNSGE